jgi:precorrin-2 dehydrogenase/sirohydrochlorin ferrochelatase
LLPIVLNAKAVSVGLAGLGEALARRLAMLAEAGVTPVPIAADSDPQDLQGLSVLFVAGLEPTDAERLAAQARGQGVFVNVEDELGLCDFHVPAIIRRGDLLLTVSTGGTAPGLARLLREWLEQKLSLEWASRLREMAQTRAGWRAAGQQPTEVSQHTRDHVAERGWLR